MAELGRDLRHFRARLALWWGQREHERLERQAKAREQYLSYQRKVQQREQQLAAGEIQEPKGWLQHPNDPPGYLRWWDGERWTEHTRPSDHVHQAQAKRDSGGLVIAGWITFGLGLLFWPVLIAPFVIGIVLAARGVAGHGSALIVLSLLGPIFSLAGCAALLTNGS